MTTSEAISEAGGRVPPGKRLLGERHSDRRATILLMAPALGFLALLAIWPFVYLIYASFTNYQLAIPLPISWVGLENFADVLGSARFWSSLKVTGVFALVNVPLQILCGLGLALLVNGVVRGREVYASLLLIPMMLVPVVVGFSWDLFLNPIYGPLNSLLKALGFAPPAWTSSATWALPTLVVADVWQWTPFCMVILLAGLRSIPKRVFEASYVDGSSTWQTFWHVTVPLLMPYMGVAFVLRFIDSFKVFDLIYVLTKGGPGTMTQNLAYYTYDVGFSRFEFGTAGALSILQLIILIVGTFIALRLIARRDKPKKAPKRATAAAGSAPATEG